MVTEQIFRKLALALEGAEELPHFEKTSFRIKKKIFATLDTKTRKATVKLSAVDQSVFSAFDATVIYPVPNAWGKQGWTIVELGTVRKDMLADILSCAYTQVASAKVKRK